MLLLLALTALYLTVGLRFIPWRKIGTGIALLRTPSDSDTGEIKPSSALATALSATVGTGNIAGVATAIAVGGPGAVFYMWMIALFGMATKFAEAVCAVEYREVDERGKYVGGPMYYLRNGVGAKMPGLGKVLGFAFALFGAFAAFGIGNGAQINSIALALENSFSVPVWMSGVVIAAMVAFVIFGGIRRIADVATFLVPIMIVLYLGSGLVIIALNFDQIPATFGLIFEYAFNPVAATGGFAGATVAAAIRYGVARGVFSNESGLGSAAIAHAAAQTNNPVRQGIIAMLGTFIDTIIVCTITALVILSSGVWSSGESGAVLTSNAFTTLLGWSYYGERCWQFIFGEKAIVIYRVLWVIAILWFANQKIDFVWNFSDTMNGLMALPNLIGLLILSPIIFAKTREYFSS